MLCTVLKSFSFSRDGVSQVKAQADATGVDIPDRLVPGLRAAGYVKEESAVVADAEVQDEMERDDVPGTVEGASPPPPRGTSDDPPRDSVDIPSDWRDLSWPQLRALAAKLSPNPITDKDSALSAIAAELTHRHA